jgi:hypothetical protein
VLKVLVACEESQAVTIELRKLGVDAYSCDLQESSGGHTEWHLQQDVLPLLKQQWDMIIAFPPCTDLAVSGARWFKEKIRNGQQQQSIDFFMQFVNCDCPHIAIENPVGIMSSLYKKPTQIIQPWQFGDPFTKTTCLWLKGLPKLQPTKIVDKGMFVDVGNGKKMSKWYVDCWGLNPKDRAKVRSKTFPGIACAMASQFTAYLLNVTTS